MVTVCILEEIPLIIFCFSTETFLNGIVVHIGNGSLCFFNAAFGRTSEPMFEELPLTGILFVALFGETRSILPDKGGHFAARGCTNKDVNVVWHQA